MKRSSIVILGLIMGAPLEGAFTLKQAQNYAMTIQEAPHVQIGANQFYPDYSAWYRQQGPSYLSRALMFLGIEDSHWTFQKFTQLLSEVTIEREKTGLSGCV